ncbi:MAG: sigma-70 family RNA polymerase sigma factor [Deltaproteobacteria bacterium]|nr:sigma-70 family RNA polymerase sigma factor [Deltaproteobacteria bacterium]
MTEEALLGLRRGDGRTLRDLHAELFPRVRAVCRQLLKAPAVADETAHDVWTDFVVDRAPGLKHPGAIAAYLHMMAVRRCCDQRRLQMRLDERDLAGEADGSESVEAHLAASSEQRELEARLAGCMERLTGRTREVLRMRFHRSMTQEAIGEVFGASKQYVGKVLKKSLEALRRCMGGKP